MNLAPSVWVRNRGGFVAVFHLSYYRLGREEHQYSGHILTGTSKSLYIPGGVTGWAWILAQEWWGFGWKDIFEYYAYPYENTCFEVWGTTLSPRWQKVRCGTI